MKAGDNSSTILPLAGRNGGQQDDEEPLTCCDGNGVLSCEQIKLDPATITNKEDLLLAPLNITLVYKGMVGDNETDYSYGNDEYDMVFAMDEDDSKSLFAYSSPGNDSRVLLIEYCGEDTYILKVIIDESLNNPLNEEKPKGNSVGSSRSSYCRYSGFNMYFGRYYVARDYYRSTCINRCKADSYCLAWTWETYYGYCYLYRATFSSYAWYKASGSRISRNYCGIGNKVCWIYSGITGVRYFAYRTGVYSASTCEASCKSTSGCNYWNWVYNTCYYYTVTHSYNSGFHSSERC